MKNILEIRQKSIEQITDDDLECIQQIESIIEMVDNNNKFYTLYNFSGKNLHVKLIVLEIRKAGYECHLHNTMKNTIIISWEI